MFFSPYWGITAQSRGKWHNCARKWGASYTGMPEMAFLEWFAVGEGKNVGTPTIQVIL